MNFSRLFILIVMLFITNCLNIQGQPYPHITAAMNGKASVYSPDPLINARWPSAKAENGLEQFELMPVNTSTANPQSFDLTDQKKGVIAVKGKGVIRFDFGRVSAGWLEFESDDMQDSITLSISEYNEPAVLNKGAIHPVKTNVPARYGHTYRLELNPELYEGVRFGWLEVHQHQHNWHIKNLRLVCQVKPVNYQGSFFSSDTLLTKIWYTGAYTVKLNLQKDYFGAILMERSDRHSWTGDAYPSQAAAMVAFGNYDFVKQNLINTSGLNNGIASYSLYWVLSLIDYVRYSGDVGFANAYAGNAAAKLDTAFQQFEKSPGLGFYGWDERLGAGFENPDNPESQNAYRMLSIRAWAEFGSLMKQLGNTGFAARFSGYAKDKLDEVRRQNKWTSQYGLHAAADAINTGLTSKKEDAIFYHHNFDDRLNRLSYSPFNQYFILSAMSRTSHYNDALHMINDYWGGQIRQGATTFYEVYRPSWNAVIGVNGAPPNNQCGYTSLTHPWSAGVVKWISEEILGIKPFSPGFKTFKVKPHLGNSLRWVSGSTSTGRGLIAVSLNRDAGRMSISVPQGTLAREVEMPLAGNDIQSVSVNGRAAILKSSAGKSSAMAYELKNNVLMLHDLGPGKYNIAIIYRSKSIQKDTIDQPWNFPISQFVQDSLTSGNWNKRYGKQGYILFNAEAAGDHLQQLPAYLSAVRVKGQANVHLKAAAQDSKLLSDISGLQRNFGAIITRDPEPTAQTFTIDLPVKDNQSHQIAMYFLDWQKLNRRSAVEIFDLKTLKIISPVQLVRNYTAGKYLIFKFKGSIRIRIDQVRGENASLSGLFFDQTDDGR